MNFKSCVEEAIQLELKNVKYSPESPEELIRAAFLGAMRLAAR